MKGSAFGYRTRPDIEHEYLMSKQDDAARTTVVAGIAEFEGVNAAQCKRTLVVSNGPEAAKGNRVVEKLQALGLAGLAGRGNSDIARLEAIQPEPGRRQYGGQAGYLQGGHKSPPPPAP